jgi:acyl carrier protein
MTAPRRGDGTSSQRQVEERVASDVIDAGLLDSLALVQLLATLEREFSVSMDLENLDLDDFRTVSSTARFIVARTGGSSAHEPVGG